ncbi:MAG: ribosome biogenesis GTPase Der [Acidobacteriota bacterium]
MKVPSIAIIGRPNVGKSTLFNRICGKRKALVGNEPGMTRDRLTETAEWLGTRFVVVDTGGIMPGDQEIIPQRIYEQAQIAMEQAAAILFVVDCRAGLTPVDLELGRLLISQSKPVFVVANKCDHVKLMDECHEFYRMGFDRLFPVSAEHGLNVAELLDDVVRTLPRGRSQPEDSKEEVTRVSILGRPNVGKSTLLNRLLGEERVLVSPIPGTTRDAVDTLFVYRGRPYQFVDTAGIRKRSQTSLLAEKLSVIMARKSLERSDVALIVIDASEGPAALDATIAGFAHEMGVSVILVVNKWDAVTKDTHAVNRFEMRVRDRIRYLDYAPIIFVSALTGQRMGKLLGLVEDLARARKQRVGTGELNAFLQKAALSKASVPFNKRVKIHYMTQVGTAPPTFALFTNRKEKLHFSIERYLVNRIRERFGFAGSPVIIKQKSLRAGG